MNSHPGRAVRVWAAVNAAAGTVMTAAPRRVLALAGPPAPPPVLVRILGARQLLQGVVLLRRPERRLLRAGVGIDTVHAVSMIAAALRYPEYRRAALLSSAAAAASAAAAVGIATRHRPPR